jgi:hypothetical protein
MTVSLPHTVSSHSVSADKRYIPTKSKAAYDQRPKGNNTAPRNRDGQGKAHPAPAFHVQDHLIDLLNLEYFYFESLLISTDSLKVIVGYLIAMFVWK